MCCVPCDDSGFILFLDLAMLPAMTMCVLHNDKIYNIQYNSTAE